MYQLTLPDKDFAIKTAEQINKDYPDQAFVVNDCCMITEAYWNKCQAYVLAKQEARRTSWEN